ncbi:MAG: ABC transporter permease [Bacteroidales bacterium]|nr:ABC transporter permease [Bacteroidales bacterium]
MRIGTLLGENIRISMSAIKSTKLRTLLTVLIIALGIMALVGILTATEVMSNGISAEFAEMGANSFTISSRGSYVRINNKEFRTKTHAHISLRQAQEFKAHLGFPALVGISAQASGSATVKYRSEQTNPNISVYGVDKDYLSVAALGIAQGRNLTAHEVTDARNVCLLGAHVASRLFGQHISPLGKLVGVGAARYRVVGVLEAKGSGFSSANEQVLIPVTSLAVHFPRPNQNHSITVLPHRAALAEAAQAEAEGAFRMVRRLSATDENDFNIERSDSLAKLLMENLGFVSLAATLIGVITLLGAAVGLMNIMLVSVAERTREIGTRKALGAKSAYIKQQFLIEAVLVCLLGGVLGVVLGIAVGNIVALIAGGAFMLPWGWMLTGLLISSGVGVVAGYLPAVKAARLNPIEALRYE